MQREIPIFFSTDDKYLPFLDVAIASLIENASRDHEYRIIILNTGLDTDSVSKIERRAADGFKIDFVNISDQIESIKSRFKNVYHFSVVTYYRMFISSMFPQYDKALYIDCDVVVLGDISKLYLTPLGDNVLGASRDVLVSSTEQFRRYAAEAIGTDPDGYVNAGILVMNLAEFRKSGIEEKFVALITEYDFDLLDPDQAYLNYLCRGRIKYIPNSWNRVPVKGSCDGDINIVHFALYKKPWQEDVEYGDHFWHYARLSPFYDEIRRIHESFGEEERAEKQEVSRRILEHAVSIVNSDNTFLKKLSES